MSKSDVHVNCTCQLFETYVNALEGEDEDVGGCVHVVGGLGV